MMRWCAPPGRTGRPSPGLREDYKKYRPNVERVISQVASRGRPRIRLRYPGTARNNAWLHDRTAALNLRMIVLYAGGQPLPLGDRLRAWPISALWTLGTDASTG